MTTIEAKIPLNAAAAGGLSESDVVELLSAFNETASRLQSVHESLRGEVARLKGELREANEQLQRSRRLAALGEMAAGIAHEVRNPLGSIRLYAGLLEQDLVDREPQRDTARKIISAVRGLDAVVTDVLAFAREMRTRPHEVDAAELLSRALDEGLAGVPGARGIEIDFDPRAMQTVEIICDPTLMHRALVNVIRNAAEAMLDPEKTCASRRLTVGVTQASLTDEHARRWDVVRIADTGPGIPPEVMERMFNPFFTTRHTGTGLGLAIVHRIVDAHAGRIEVRNTPGEHGGGAVVELWLPGMNSGSERAGARDGPAT